MGMTTDHGDGTKPIGCQGQTSGTAGTGVTPIGERNRPTGMNGIRSTTAQAKTILTLILLIWCCQIVNGGTHAKWLSVASVGNGTAMLGRLPHRVSIGAANTLCASHQTTTDEECVSICGDSTWTRTVGALGCTWTSLQKPMLEARWTGNSDIVSFSTCLLYTSPSPRD